jgi:hypothetical protein
VRSTATRAGRPTSSTTTPKGTRMSPTDDELVYAVMQDDTVLCADCVSEVCDDRQPSAATTLHAWLAPDLGHVCSWCGASDAATAEAA